MRYGKKGKPSPGYIGLFKILKRIGPVAYIIELPPALSRIHDIFHVSMLRRYVLDPSHMISYESLEIGDALAYDEVPAQILDRKIKELHIKDIPLVKELWRNHTNEEASWELEMEIRNSTPQLFSGS
ncbi:uncharacterized protein LOC131162778 [Malania oleifera]|uniref:uncharacterized protein LOC131162778 n=1 Tax=Malania oleifera TaxID=397392 RepID=UPI0025AE72B6|nr:uncharacterized protein LOC131162778 [Malania oleifera]